MDDAQLQSRARQHRLFFDSLVELIPAKFYIAKEEEHTQHHGMKKAERAAAKQLTKRNLKKAKRDRLDPEKATSTLQLLQQHQEKEKEKEKETSDSEGSDGEANGTANNNLQGKESRVSTYEELRERLRKRMQMLRAKRNADTAVATARNARSWKNEKKRDSQKNRKRKGGDIEENEVPKQKQQKQENGDARKEKKAGEADTSLEFGKVKMGIQSDKIMKGKKKHKKDSKEHLLAKAAKLQSEMKDPEKGQEVTLKHAWSAALSRASGEKVFDDPNKIKQSLKREKSKRLKSVKKWEDRQNTVKEAVEARQQTRDEHIKERKQQKLERKIAKREKKLLRPGFEGRRESFLNE